MRTLALPIGWPWTQPGLREDEGLNARSLPFPGFQVSTKNTRAARFCSSCFESQTISMKSKQWWRRCLGNAFEWRKHLYKCFTFTVGFKKWSAARMCLFVGRTVQATVRKGTMTPAEKKRALPTLAFLPPPGSFQLHKGRHIFHIIAKHVCLLNYSLIS